MGVKQLIILFFALFVNKSFSCSYFPYREKIRFTDNSHAYIEWTSIDGSMFANGEMIYKKDFPQTGFYEIKSRKLLWEVQETSNMNFYPLRNNRNAYATYYSTILFKWNLLFYHFLKMEG